MAQLAGKLAPASLRKRRLFISRADSSRGADREPRFGNTEALLAALARLEIEPIVAGRLDRQEYLETFVNAELIVGLHGAGLMNLVLTPTPRVLELTAPGYPDWHSLSLFMHKGMGAPYRRVTSAPPVDGVFEYDVPATVDACEALLATPCPKAPLPL